MQDEEQIVNTFFSEIPQNTDEISRNILNNIIQTPTIQNVNPNLDLMDVDEENNTQTSQIQSNNDSAMAQNTSNQDINTSNTSNQPDVEISEEISYGVVTEFGNLVMQAFIDENEVNKKSSEVNQFWDDIISQLFYDEGIDELESDSNISFLPNGFKNNFESFSGILPKAVRDINDQLVYSRVNFVSGYALPNETDVYVLKYDVEYSYSAFGKSVYPVVMFISQCSGIQDFEGEFGLVVNNILFSEICGCKSGQRSIAPHHHNLSVILHLYYSQFPLERPGRPEKNIMNALARKMKYCLPSGLPWENHNISIENRQRPQIPFFVRALPPNIENDINNFFLPLHENVNRNRERRNGQLNIDTNNPHIEYDFIFTLPQHQRTVTESGGETEEEENNNETGEQNDNETEEQTSTESSNENQTSFSSRGRTITQRDYSTFNSIGFHNDENHQNPSH